MAGKNQSGFSPIRRNNLIPDGIRPSERSAGDFWLRLLGLIGFLVKIESLTNA